MVDIYRFIAPNQQRLGRFKFFFSIALESKINDARVTAVNMYGTISSSWQKDAIVPSELAGARQTFSQKNYTNTLPREGGRLLREKIFSRGRSVCVARLFRHPEGKGSDMLNGNEYRIYY